MVVAAPDVHRVDGHVGVGGQQDRDRAERVEFQIEAADDDRGGAGSVDQGAGERGLGADGGLDQPGVGAMQAKGRPLVEAGHGCGIDDADVDGAPVALHHAGVGEVFADPDGVTQLVGALRDATPDAADGQPRTGHDLHDGLFGLGADDVPGEADDVSGHVGQGADGVGAEQREGVIVGVPGEASALPVVGGSHDVQAVERLVVHPPAADLVVPDGGDAEGVGAGGRVVLVDVDVQPLDEPEVEAVAFDGSVTADRAPVPDAALDGDVVVGAVNPRGGVGNGFGDGPVDGDRRGAVHCGDDRGQWDAVDTRLEDDDVVADRHLAPQRGVAVERGVPDIGRYSAHGLRVGLRVVGAEVSAGESLLELQGAAGEVDVRVGGHDEARLQQVGRAGVAPEVAAARDLGVDPGGVGRAVGGAEERHKGRP